MSVEIDGVNNIIKADTISEVTSANGVAVDGLTIKDGGIVGATTITTADNNPQLTLTSTDTDANSGPRLDFIRNPGEAGADADFLSAVLHRGYNDATELTTFVEMNAQIVDASNGSEDGRFYINTMVAGTAATSRMELTPTETVFNEASADLDFRVESNGNANMLFVDGGNNRVGIGTSSPSQLVDIVTSDNSPLMEIRSTVTPNGSKFGGGIVLGLSQANDSGSGQPDTQAGDTLGRIIFEGQGTDFTYNGAEISTIVTVGDGDDGRVNQATALVFKTIGVGGDSSAERFRVSASGIHIGGTGSANALDDYEEGTFTMGMADASGNALTMNGTYAVMHYTKIGNMVHINGLPVVSSIASAGSDVRITGLPFTSKNHATNYSTLAIGYAGSLSIPDDTVISAYVNQNSTIAPMRIWTNTTGTDQLSASQLSDGAEFVISGTYIAA
jgi:prepilin-type processing-associated H-X9-DG protein